MKAALFWNGVNFLRYAWRKFRIVRMENWRRNHATNELRENQEQSDETLTLADVSRKLDETGHKLNEKASGALSTSKTWAATLVTAGAGRRDGSRPRERHHDSPRALHP